MMEINHHVSDELLLTYAAGRLRPAPALVVATHLAMSEKGEKRLNGFEQIGGALLDEQPMAELKPDLFDRTLARLDALDAGDMEDSVFDHAALQMGIDIPQPLRRRRISRWRTIAPGMRFANVEVPEDPLYKVVLLRVAPGTAMPQHGHDGSELTLILKGSFSDEEGTYGPGDLEEEDGSVNHRPVVHPDGECICLSAIEGRLRPNGLVARVMMPLFGF